MILNIPLVAHPNQRFDVVLGGQYCTIYLRQKEEWLFFGIVVDGVQPCDSVLCLDRQPVLVDDYRGFVGSLYFRDNQGETPPNWENLGSRYELIYEY